MGGKNALAAEAAARLAGLAVFDWDWQTALALVHRVPGSWLAAVIADPLHRPDDGRAIGRRAEPARRRPREPSAPGRSSVLECLARGFVGAWSDDLSAARHDLETITAARKASAAA